MYDYTIDLEDSIMKTFILAILISITCQVHAGDLIFLNNYRLEKLENKSSSWEAEREREWGRERREAKADTQVKVNGRRSFEDYTIRRIKNKRKIEDIEENSPFLEYQF